MEKTELAVGDSTRLEIIFSTKSYRSRVTKRPRIQTNEGPPDKNVSITATIVPRPDSTFPIIITPYKVDLSQLGEKVIEKQPIRIKNVSESPLDIKMVASEDSYFDVDLPESVGPGEEVQGLVQLKGDVHSESFEKSFTIELIPPESASIATSRFTVPVKRTVRMNQAGGRTMPGQGGK